MDDREEDPKDPFRLRDDPGWRPGPRRGRPDGLVAVRMVFLQFSIALLLFGFVVIWMSREPPEGSVSAWVAAVVVVIVGAAGLVCVRLGPTRLDLSDELALARSWRTRFFARLGASEAAALAGFVGFVLSGRPFLYPLGLAFTAVGFAVSGPMHANLVRDQERLALDGCPYALVPALRHPVTRDTR